MTQLIKAIEQYEVVKNISDGDFARIIGIDRSLLSHLRSGKALAGRRILGGIVRNIPELRMAVLDDLATDETAPNK